MRYLTGRHLSRRTVLRGAGATLALPLLQSMLPAGRAAAATPRSRFACIYIPHGAIMSRWTPAATARRSSSRRSCARSSRYRDRLNVVSDLTLPLAYGEDASAGANHTRSSAVWLTCARPETGATPRLGTSVDQVAAQHFGQDTPLPSLELSLEEGGLSGGSGSRARTATRSHGARRPHRCRWSTIRRSCSSGCSATAARRPSARARRREAASLLDSVLDDTAALSRSLPGDDRARLERHLDDVREVERRIELAGQQGRRTTSPCRRSRPACPTTSSSMRSSCSTCSRSRGPRTSRASATLMIAKEVSNTVYPASGINDPFHNLSHHSEVPANIERYARLNAYHTRTTLGVLPRQAARHARTATAVCSTTRSCSTAAA